MGEERGVCEAVFSSRRQLLLHQSNSKLPNHGYRVLARVVTVSNSCILCGNMYSTKRIASEHLIRSLVNRTCPRSRGSAVVFEHLHPPPYA
eukprot:8461760-Pyramimonas_sp.AAC.1